jgi:leader peptidase (prepilin peptidase)/N-methyltransferase
VLVVVGVLAGLAVGSFTNVVIDRLPLALDRPNEFGESWDTRPWREVLAGTSRCSACGHAIRPPDELPVVSWLVLRGRCRDCGVRIPSFHPVVELAVPVLWVVLVRAVGWGWAVAPALLLVPVGLAVAVIDLRTLMVPTRLVWPALAGSIVLSVVSAVALGEPGLLVTAAVGALSLMAPLALLWWFVPGGMGFGDVRLAVLLGWTVGFSAGTRPVAGVLLSVMCLGLAAVIGLVLGLVVLGVRGRRARVPFGPALVAAAFVCIALAEPMLEPLGVFLR